MGESVSRVRIRLSVRQHASPGRQRLGPILKEFLPEEDIARIGEQLSHRRAEIFEHDHMDTVRPFPGVPTLFHRLRSDGHKIVLGTSAKGEELEKYVKLLGIEGLTDGQTSADDADKSKPHPDIFLAALAKIADASPEDAVGVWRHALTMPSQPSAATCDL
jgi:beta-phosphoglucomutase-like phosphatase (HAD superfamily)